MFWLIDREVQETVFKSKIEAIFPKIWVDVFEVIDGR